MNRLILTILLLMMVSASAQNASTSSSTSSTETTLLTQNTTTTTLVTTTSTTIGPTTTTTISVANVTNDTLPTIGPIPEGENRTLIPPPTETTYTTTTSTIPTHVCGNMYKEYGEECDTLIDTCGPGSWECIDCKCTPATTTSTTIKTTTTIKSNATTQIPTTSSFEMKPEYIVGIFAIAVTAFVVAIYKLGGKE